MTATQSTLESKSISGDCLACSQCGSRIPLKNCFCTDCGASLDGADKDGGTVEFGEVLLRPFEPDARGFWTGVLWCIALVAPGAACYVINVYSGVSSVGLLALSILFATLSSGYLLHVMQKSARLEGDAAVWGRLVTAASAGTMVLYVPMVLLGELTAGLANAMAGRSGVTVMLAGYFMLLITVVGALGGGCLTAQTRILDTGGRRFWRWGWHRFWAVMLFSLVAAVVAVPVALLAVVISTKPAEEKKHDGWRRVLSDLAEKLPGKNKKAAGNKALVVLRRLPAALLIKTPVALVACIYALVQIAGSLNALAWSRDTLVFHRPVEQTLNNEDDLAADDDSATDDDITAPPDDPAEQTIVEEMTNDLIPDPSMAG